MTSLPHSLINSSLSGALLSAPGLSTGDHGQTLKELGDGGGGSSGLVLISPEKTVRGDIMRTQKINVRNSHPFTARVLGEVELEPDAVRGGPP